MVKIDSTIKKSNELKRAAVYGMALAGMAVVDICQKLKVTRCFAERWIKRGNSGETLSDKKRSGRPTKYPADVAKQIKCFIYRKRHRSLRTAQKMYYDTMKQTIPLTSLHRIVKSMNLRAFHLYRVPILTPDAILCRIRFAKAYKNIDASRIIFSDEKYFTIRQKRNSKNDVVWSLHRHENMVYSCASKDIGIMIWGAI